MPVYFLHLLHLRLTMEGRIIRPCRPCIRPCPLKRDRYARTPTPNQPKPQEQTMGRSRAKRIKRKQFAANNTARPLDATPERLAMCESEWINPAEIDSSEQQIGYVRRLRTNHLDRLHRAEVITWRQWYPANDYRETWERAQLSPRVVGSYGERSTGGENDYGLARTEAAYRARLKWRRMRDVIPMNMRGYVDRLVLHNRMPSLRNRDGRRTLAQIKSALDQLAGWYFND